MKNSIKLFAFIILGALATQSCTYEKGPKLTLLTKTARISRQWKTVKYEDSNGNTQNATDNGSYVEFTKDGVYTSHDGTFNIDLTGTWEFSSDKKNLKTSYQSGSFSFTSESEILRLTSSELQLKDSNGDITYMEAK